jgi:hypothetical protein
MANSNSQRIKRAFCLALARCLIILLQSRQAVERCTAFMRISLPLVAMLLTLSAAGQAPARFTVKLKGWHGDSRKVPSHFDTVYLHSKLAQFDTIYTHISTPDSIFQLPGVPVGKYRLMFSAQRYCVTGLYVAVCNKCDNAFEFFSYPKTAGENCGGLEMVEISAGYKGGSKALSKDFQKGLTKKERKQLKSGPDFKAQLFLTRQKTVSDIVITPANLPPYIKNSIVKGLTQMNNWLPTIRNGVIVDDIFELDKQELLSP